MVQKSDEQPVEFGRIYHYVQGFSTISGGFLAEFLKHQQYLVVGFNPSEKCWSNGKSSPNRSENKNISNHHLGICLAQKTCPVF